MSDFGHLLLRGADLRMKLTRRIAAALSDPRQASYTRHSYHDLLAQNICQIGRGDEDGVDTNNLRHAPRFELGAALSWHRYAFRCGRCVSGIM